MKMKLNRKLTGKRTQDELLGNNSSLDELVWSIVYSAILVLCRLLEFVDFVNVDFVNVDFIEIKV